MEKKASSIFYGWWVVAACFAISLFVNGIIGFGFTALIEPLSTKFGWSYTQISFASSLRGLEVGVLAPVMGFLVDRWGPRRMIFIGVVFCGLAMLLLSQATSLPMFYLSFGLISLGMSALSPTVTMTTVAFWFHKRLGQATGIMHSGVGFSGLMLPVVVTLIDSFGIEKAMLTLGGISLAIIAPLALIIRNRPQELGLLPDGDHVDITNQIGDKAPKPDVRHDFSLKEAFQTRAFWLLALAMLFQLMLVNAMATHMMPYLSSIGITRTVASLIASAMPLTSVFGRLGFGWMSDRIDQRHIMATGYGMMSIGMLFFTLAVIIHPLFLFPAVPIFSAGFGGNATVRASLLRNYYGMKNFGTIHGLVMGLAVIGNLTGPPLAGWVFDGWGSYRGIWAAFTGAALAPMAFMLVMPKAKAANEKLA